jgi:CspA family cold shock protein
VGAGSIDAGQIIERPDGSDIFVHYSDIVGSGFRTLTEGQEVQFQVSKSSKGPQAVKVQRVEER